jgi:hypothetical protein
VSPVSTSFQSAVEWAREHQSWSLLNVLEEDGPDPKVDYEVLIRMMEDKCQSTTK